MHCSRRGGGREKMVCVLTVQVLTNNFSGCEGDDSNAESEVLKKAALWLSFCGLKASSLSCCLSLSIEI